VFQGLEILDEATSILTRFLQRSTTANAEIAEVNFPHVVFGGLKPVHAFPFFAHAGVD